MLCLLKDKLSKRWKKYENKSDLFIDKKAFEIASLKVEKVNGDLRTAFDIVRNSIQKKITYLENEFSSVENNSDWDYKKTIGMEDVNKVITELYRSKTFDTVRKVPRSHLILLKIIEQLFSEEGYREIRESKLLMEYNKRVVKL